MNNINVNHMYQEYPPSSSVDSQPDTEPAKCLGKPSDELLCCQETLACFPLVEGRQIWNLALDT